MKKHSPSVSRYMMVSGILLAVTVVLSMVLELGMIRKHHRDMALETAESYANVILAVVRWVSLYHGVYVPANENEFGCSAFSLTNTVETLDGQILCRMDSAEVARLLSGITYENQDVRFRLTGLVPLNPLNRPDPWEKEALTAIQASGQASSTISKTAAGTYFRYITPIIVEENCLRCHTGQGFQVGGVGGGISVFLNYASYEQVLRESILKSILVSLMFLGVIGSVICAVGRKHLAVENELRKLSQAVEQCANSIVITDTKGRIEYINPKFTEITGYSTGEVLGANPRILKSGAQSEEFYRRLWLTISAGEPWSGEFQNRRKNGELFWEKASVAPVKDASGKIINFVAIKEDITRLKEAEARQRQLIQELERSNGELEAAYTKIFDDIDKARELHQRFLPTIFPEVGGLAIAAHYQPAASLGGDFYNVVRYGDQLLIYLVDVSGHGLEGAMLTIFVRETINNFLAVECGENRRLSPAEILHYLASRFHQEGFPGEYFICLLVGVLDLQTARFTCGNAGLSVAPAVASYDGKVELLPCAGLPISAAIDLDLMIYGEETFTFRPGTTILFATDGAVEQTANGRMYGEKRLREVLRQHHRCSPQQIIDAVMDDIGHFTGAALGDDDITILVIQGNFGDTLLNFCSKSNK